MNVSYTTKSGFECGTSSAHMALMEWFMHQHPEKDEYYFSAKEDQFLVQIEAAIERHYNRTPTVLSDLPHEAKCKRYLLWLHEHGELTDLRFNDSDL